MTPPADRATGPAKVVVYADGGSRGNPGPAGYGAVVLDPDGTVLAERAAGLGRATNNVAEYSGLIAGLQAARDLGAAVVEVRMDSRLVVEQVSGRWKIKHPALQPLALAAQRLVGEFELVTFDWVPRAQNALADALANAAMDAQARGEQWRPTAGPGGDPGAGADDPAGGAVAGDENGDGDDDLRPGADDPAAGPHPDPDGTTTLLVVRHGESEWGAQHRFAGREDVALSARGRRQAAALGHRLASTPVHAVVSSPLVRCRDTAAAVVAGLDTAPPAGTAVLEGLVDADLGDWTGATADELAERDPERALEWGRDPAAAPPGGESYEDVRRRTTPVVKQLVAEHRGRTVLVVAHAAVVKAVLVAAWGAPTALAFRTRIDTGSLSRVEVAADGSAVVVSVNDTGHLEDVSGRSGRSS